MGYRREILKGYSWSFLSPIIVTLLAFICLFVLGFSSDSLGSMDTLLALTFMVGLFGLMFNAIFCGVLLVLIYCFLRGSNYLNKYTLPLVGAIAGYLFSAFTGQVHLYTILYITYGGVSGFFFWYGSQRPSRK